MVAVAACMTPKQPNISFSDLMLSPAELEIRLEKWAKFGRSREVGSTGRGTGYLRERLDSANDSEEFTDEIATTERAIARTAMEDKAYEIVIKEVYLGRHSIHWISLYLHVSESGLNRLFLQAKDRIRAHIFDIEQGP